MKSMTQKGAIQKGAVLLLVLALALGLGCLAAQAAGIDVTLSASPNPVIAPGTVRITITVANNTGDTIDSLSITNTPPAGVAWPSFGASMPVASGGSASGYADVAVTQAEMDAGADLQFTADVTAGTAGSGNFPATGTVTVRIDQLPSLSLSAGNASAGFAGAGETVSVEYLVVNDGNVELTGVTLAGVLPAGAAVSGGPFDLAAPDPLNPTAPSTFTVTYTTTQADVDAGAVNFSARAVGVAPAGGEADSGALPISIPGPQAAPDLTLMMLTQPPAFTGAGQAISAVYQVTNTGNVTMNGLALAEVAPAGASVSGGASTLAPGGAASFTVTHTTTQANVDAGTVSFSAKATGTPQGGSAVTTPAAAASAAGPQAAPGATLTLAASPGTYSWAGQSITLTFTVTNAGNVTLSNLSGALAAPAQAVVFTPATLAPGGRATGAVTYTVTPANVSDRRALDFSGTASATAPSGAGVAIPAASVTVGYQPSDDATLRAVLGRRIGSSRRPGTQANPKTATVYVRHSARMLREADWEPNHPRAWVSFGDSWRTLGHRDMPLEVGKNDIFVQVTAESNARLFYRITIWRADADGNFYDARDLGGPFATTLSVDGSVIPVTVSPDGGLVIPFTALLLDSSSAPVAIDPPQFGPVSYLVLEVPPSWFDETGHRRRFDIAGMGMLEINDRMMENVELTQAVVRITVRRGQLEVGFTQGGVPLQWDNFRNPILIGVPYIPEAGTRLAGVALYLDRGPYEPKRAMPRSWYSEEDGMVYGYVRQNGRYAAADMLADLVVYDVWGAELDEAAYALMARGVLDGLPKPLQVNEGAEAGEKQAYGWYNAADLVTRAEFVHMLMRALDVELTGEWLPEMPPADIGEAAESLHTAMLQAVALGIVPLDEAGAFRPNEQITRQEVLELTYWAMVAANAMPAIDLDTVDPEELAAVLAAFADWESVGEQARAAIQVLALLRIVQGEELRPYAAASLGEAVQLLAETLRYGQSLFEERYAAP
ncbi:MAG: S-layer homology domain-containing protein [Clostridia bacterium]|nr:S-layer homology domain-containing protein [Clostridia bacterium]